LSLLVVGLGNPGPEYAWTPHNLGFLALERLAHLRGALFDLAAVPRSYDGPRDFRAARDARSGALLVQPLGFMNRSGAAVAPLAQWAGSRPDQVLVVYDDLDLPPAALRLRPHGGTGGHRGVESIVTSLGTDRFPRLRVGIGRPRTEAARHVLTPIPAEQRGDYERALAEAAEALAFWLDTGDLERCMSRYHSRWNPPE
jgi:PTH1 family peptidyl-tRNA hydrolase